jgi:hypothetical protein
MPHVSQVGGFAHHLLLPGDLLDLFAGLHDTDSTCSHKTGELLLGCMAPSCPTM